MDVNGLRCWQIADAGAFGVTAGHAENLYWRDAARLLTLDRQQDKPAVTEDRIYAVAQALKPSPVVDPGGSFAWWDGLAGTITAAGFADGTTTIPIAPDVPVGLPQPTDLAYGADDILYVARNDAVVMTDRRDRFADAHVALAGFKAQRLAPAVGGGVWALDRMDGTLALLTGKPLRREGYDEPDPTAFFPIDPNPCPPQLRLLKTAKLPAGREGVAIAASPGGQVGVLAWRAGADAEIYTLDGHSLVRRFALDGVEFPYSLAWNGEERVAVLVSDVVPPNPPGPAGQAYVYEVILPPSDTATARPVGEVHPLLGAWDGGFCNTLADVAIYPIWTVARDTPSGTRRLRAVSRTTYARSGQVMLGPFDAGQSGAVWHRLRIEAAIPDHAGMRLWLHADDGGAVPKAPGVAGAPAWALHVAGQAAVMPDVPDAPIAAWCDTPSEFAFNPGLLFCPAAPGRAGRFDVLIQAAGKRVRRVEGRYLYLYLELIGDSLATPELAALRIWGSRFAYRDRYLPGLYQERLAGDDALAAGPATGPDFLDRFLGTFEAPLTELEGSVADSWLLTDPEASPEAALPWLGSWIGIAPALGEAPSRLREELRAAPFTAALHGTLGGLLAALELATGGVVITGGTLDPAQQAPRPGQRALATLGDETNYVLVLDTGGDSGTTVLAGGAVTRGEIVVVEGYRMRRTFATILGADLQQEDDPLTLGHTPSGNSFVGDTLILGDQAQKDVAALFSAQMPQSASDTQAVAAFFARLAYQVMVLVRPSPRTTDLARLRDVADAASPAHVETTVLQATWPLIVGAASLVGVDSYLTPPPPVRAVRVGRTRVGGGDRVMGNGRLDQRGDAPVTLRPVAVVDGPAIIQSGTSFLVSSARSQAARGRTIAQSIWTWI